MKILVLNCGSSSIKYQLFDMDNNANVLAKGIVERVGMKDSELTHKRPGKEKFSIIKNIPDHTVGIDIILDILMDKKYGVIEDKHEISAVGHRVAHGGEFFKKSSLITPEAIANIEACSELAPLHNPANLKGIYAMQKILPGIPQVAVFDTSFHQTMPAYAYLYPVPYELYEKYKVRRYGFHGTSHKYVAQKACEYLGLKFENTKIITCHLGNGASIAAIKDGKSVDTSMGFTPVEGLMMGTRCGDFDLGALLYIMDREKLTLDKANNLINKKSGLLGISGFSSDMRDIEGKAFLENDERAKLAFEMFYYRVKKYVGSYAAIMGGVDLIIFTGGIGENGWEIRENICSDMEFLGLHFNKVANKDLYSKAEVISQPDSKVKVMVYPTDEEYVIAQDTLDLVN